MYDALWWPAFRAEIHSSRSSLNISIPFTMSTMPSTVTFTKPVARLKPVQRLPSLVTRHYVCPSCLSSARVSGRPRPNAFQSQRRPSSRSLVTRTPRTSSSKRQASSIAPVISINARKNIPKTLEELHGRLRDLEKKVGCFVNLSHLKLAIRGLESENAVVRVAGMLPVID